MIKEKMTIIDAITALNAFNGIEGKASIDMSWAIDDIREILEKHNKRFNDEKQKLLDTYGRVGGAAPNGGVRYVIPKENLETYNTEIKALSEIEISLEFEPIEFDSFIGQNLGIDVSLGRALRKFIKKTPMKQEEVKPEKKSFKERVDEKVKANRKAAKKETVSENGKD